MAYHGVDDVLVNVQLVQHFICLDAVLLRVQLKIYIMQHTHRAPEVDVLRVVLFGELPHDL